MSSSMHTVFNRYRVMMDAENKKIIKIWVIGGRPIGVFTRDHDNREYRVEESALSLRKFRDIAMGRLSPDYYTKYVTD